MPIMARWVIDSIITKASQERRLSMYTMLSSRRRRWDEGALPREEASLKWGYLENQQRLLCWAMALRGRTRSRPPPPPPRSTRR